MALGSQIGFLSLTFCVQPIEWDSLWGNLSVFMSQITLLGVRSPLIVSFKLTVLGQNYHCTLHPHIKINSKTIF